jgi:hypothetical protein
VASPITQKVKHLISIHQDSVADVKGYNLLTGMMVVLDSFLDYVAVMAGDCVDFLTVTLSLILTLTVTYKMMIR